MTGRASDFRQRQRERRLPPAQATLFDRCVACQAVDTSGCWYDDPSRTKTEYRPRPKGCLAAPDPSTASLPERF